MSHEHAEQLPQNLFLLERSGRYEEAVSEVDNMWEDKTKVPLIEEYKPRLSAEIILRCGSVFGFLGHNKRIPNSQKISRNTLIEARNRYLNICDIEKVAECENYIALSYRRTGELNEAEIWVDEALSRDISKSSHTRLYSLLIQSMIYIANGNSEQVVLDFGKVQSIFKEHGDDFLKGSFCTNMGIALTNIGRTSEALTQYELARKYHQKSKHQIYLGTVENNLAFQYKLQKRFTEAHQAVDNALKIYQQINDKTRKGSSLDTKAQIYFAEGKYNKALDFANKAIKILEKSENVSYLVEAYVTKIKTLITLNKTFEVIKCLTKAVSIAESCIGEDASNRLAKEIGELLDERIAPVITNAFGEKQIVVKGFSKEVYEEVFDEDYDENNELILPLELRKYRKLDGVKMSNNNLKEIGIYEGSLAIIAEEEEIINGDLIVILELEDQSVHCGYYSADFDFISLEKPDTEVQLFSENEITILGKIVGVGDKKDEQGRLIIRPI